MAGFACAPPAQDLRLRCDLPSFPPTSVTHITADLLCRGNNNNCRGARAARAESGKVSKWSTHTHTHTHAYIPTHAHTHTRHLSHPKARLITALIRQIGVSLVYWLTYYTTRLASTPRERPDRAPVLHFEFKNSLPSETLKWGNVLFCFVFYQEARRAPS